MYYVTVPEKPFHRVVDEHYDVLVNSLVDIGLFSKSGEKITLLPQIASEWSGILYNLEPQTNAFPGYWNALRSYPKVWSYDASHGFPTLEVGYHPCLERITKESTELGTVFIGSITERRRKLLPDTVTCYFNVFGEERDAILSNARLVINCHAYDNSPFEIIRCQYLMANKIPFITEGENPYGIPHFKTKEELQELLDITPPVEEIYNNFLERDQRDILWDFVNQQN